METPLPEPKAYDGNCHCGGFKFTVKMPSKPYHTCNCSVCQKKGIIGMWPIEDEDITMHQGKGTLTEYQFGRKYLTHLFCPKCGSSVMGRTNKGETKNGINIRMLKNFHEYFEANKHDNPPVNFAAVEPQYKAPPFPSHPDADNLQPDQKICNGNCHCGAVAYAVKTKPLEEQKVMSCNCSLCSRNGDLWIYPPKSAVIIQGAENLTDYKFLSEDSLHSFCKICGVSVCVKVEDGEEDPVMPINVRTMDGVDISTLTLQKYDGAKNDPKYEV
ncbi:uncharacterized protein K444DRAFT_598507 [Hyaloscypha bicolor E]|uniref:CENP-V/GFA domain-containing protein n=1 Tax=Hyaloscypha bicolor E TaxID=1095630 RepID=A0A2J6STK6_9HELO|nr:uncharacterized protein K444DRAFT_598507 [Hyaloscypha bicolor E]PMD54089.1 hypothetical protein K444DRAFT_598507 [Hyaloscypha bicolor E]